MIDENDRKPRPLVAARAAQTAKNRALARQPRSRAKFFSSLLEQFLIKMNRADKPKPSGSEMRPIPPGRRSGPLTAPGLGVNPDYGVLQDEAAMECAAARPSLTIFGVVVGKSEAAR